ncbi:MAG: YcxB family protein [Eubacterium sp.]|nr:YcxB family protein [Eubacterium sp.]
MKFMIHLTDEDYIRFNIFYSNHSKAGKRAVNLARIAFPVLSLAVLTVFFSAGAEFGKIAVNAILLTAVSFLWFFYVPKIIEKSIRKNINKMKADGKLPFHEHAQIEFQDDKIVEKNDQEEVRVKYTDIEQICPTNEYLYIFYSAVQAFIIPYHCLGADKEALLAYVTQKKKTK